MADTKQRTRKDRKSEAPAYEAAFELEEKTIEIRRVSKVVQGGRRFAFRVTVVVGDRSGQVSAGVGKATTVQKRSAKPPRAPAKRCAA